MGFQETNISVRESEHNFTVCLQLIKGSIVRGNTISLPIVVTGGGKLFITYLYTLQAEVNQSNK